MKEYDYPERFEKIWRDIKLKKNSCSKSLGHAVYLILTKQSEDIENQLKEKNKLIKELLNNVNACDNCGCTELLCGYRGFNEGCTSERRSKD